MFTCAAEADVGESVSAENGGAVSDGSRRLEDITAAAVCDWRRWRRQIEALHQVVDKVKCRHAWHVPSKFAQQQHFPNLWFVQKMKFIWRPKKQKDNGRNIQGQLSKRIKNKKVDGKKDKTKRIWQGRDPATTFYGFSRVSQSNRRDSSRNQNKRAQKQSGRNLLFGDIKTSINLQSGALMKPPEIYLKDSVVFLFVGVAPWLCFKSYLIYVYVVRSKSLKRKKRAIYETTRFFL